MVPSISRNGQSFRGAGAYHLHDKPSAHDPRPRTSQRVAFTATRNLANEDPRAALDEMWRTAEDAPHMNANSGAAPQGRKSDTRVKTVSLAWAPGQTPTRTDMTAAADGFLLAMGWHAHQAVYAAHNDTSHPHLHIIINRVHPETGRTLNDWQERKRAQHWALAYERGQGGLLCKARAVRYETAAAAAPAAGLPYVQARLIAHQSAAARHALAVEARAAFRPVWAAHFRRQRTILAALAAEQRSSQRLAASLAREGDAHGALHILTSLQRRQVRTLRSLAGQRAALGRAQYASLRTRVRSLASAPQQPAAQVPALVRYPVVVNDNPAQHSMPSKPAVPHSGLRFRALPAAIANKPPVNTVPLLRASHRSERQLLLAMQAAAYAALRRNASPARHASGLARSEIALAFASRWADSERMPAALRAAAVAALKAEQAAALSARLRYHVMRLHSDRRPERLGVSRQHNAARRALAYHHKLAWAAAAAKAQRAPRPLPPARGGAAPFVAAQP